MAANMRRRKRRRKGAFRSSNDDELNLDDIVKTGMDDKLEDIVSKTNLTAINVKSILHHILKDKRVLRMALNAAKSDKKDEGEKAGHDSDKQEDYSPKLTRSRLRQKVGTPHQSPVKQGVPSLHLSPAKLESELYELLNTTLSESSDEDAEYEPEDLENAASDRESETGDEEATSAQADLVESRKHADIPDSLGDVRCIGETDQIMEELSPKCGMDLVVGQPSPMAHMMTVADSVEEQQHDTEAHLQSGSVHTEPDTGHEMMPGIDTLSNICTEQLPHAEISNTEKQDLIAVRTRSRCPLTETSLEDLEASFLAPDIPPDLYEWIENPAIEDIEWQQWLTDLMRTDKSDQTEDNDEDDPEYKAPQVTAEEEEEEYRTDMAVKVSYKELSSLLEEFIETYDSEIGIVGNQTESGLIQVSSASDNTTQVLELIANACVPVTNLVKEMDEAEKSMSEGQIELLTSQLQQHIQLLCQTYLLSRSDPNFQTLHSQSHYFLLQISNEQSKAGTEGRETVYDIPGISEIRLLLNDDGSMESDNSVSLTICSDRNRPLPPHAVHFIATALSSKSLLFPYLDLLPLTGLMMVSEQTPGDQRVKFTAAEDNLMALGMTHYDKNWSVIQSKLLPSKTLKQLQIRYKNLCSSRAPDNPVKHWKKTGELALVAIPVYTPRSMILSPDKLDVSSGVSLPDWLLSFFRRQLNQRNGLPSVNQTADEEPSVEKSKKKRKGRKCDDGTSLWRIAPATASASVAQSDPPVKTTRSHTTTPVQQENPSTAACQVSTHIGNSREVGKPHVDPTGLPTNLKEDTQIISQILHERSVLVLPSVSDTDTRPPPLTPVKANPNLTVTTSVGRTPISSTGVQGFVRKAPSSSRAVIQQLLQEPDPKASEKAGKFAKWYLAQVQASLRDHPDQYSEFVRKLLSYKSGKSTIQEMYTGIVEVLSDWPDLVHRFVGFLGPDEGLAAGAFSDSLDFAQALNFLRKLEVYFRKAPNHLQKIVKAFRQFPCVEGHTDEIRQKVLPLLKHKELIDDFNEFFKTKSLLERFPGSFEVVELDSGSDFEVDEFEEIRMSSSSDKEETASASAGIRCRMCRKLVRRRNLVSSSPIFQSGNSKQKRLVGSEKATVIRYCCCKGRRRSGVKSKQIQRHQVPTATAAFTKMERCVRNSQSGGKVPETGSIEQCSRSVTEQEAPLCTVPPVSTSDRNVVSQATCGDIHLPTGDRQRDADDIVPSETDTIKDVAAGSDVDIECMTEDIFMSDHICIGEDTGEDTNVEQSVSPDSTQEAMVTDSDLEECAQPVAKQEQQVTGKSVGERVGDQKPADNETVGEDGHVLTWTKEEDRIILSSCQQRGLTQETFVYVSELIGKTDKQVEQRMCRLMQLFQSSASH